MAILSAKSMEISARNGRDAVSNVFRVRNSKQMLHLQVRFPQSWFMCTRML